MRTDYEATEPQRALEKFEESRQRLIEMADHEQALNPQKFLYALSGFLYAFRTTAYRLIGVARTRKGAQAGRDLRNKMLANPTIAFLKDRSDLETHGNGPVIWKHYTVNVSSSMHSRWDREDDPWPNRYNHSRFESRWGSIRTNVHAAEWRFADRQSENLIALCYDALAALEEFIRESLAVPVPQSVAAKTLPVVPFDAAPDGP